MSSILKELDSLLKKQTEAKRKELLKLQKKNARGQKMQDPDSLIQKVAPKLFDKLAESALSKPWAQTTLVEANNMFKKFLESGVSGAAPGFASDLSQMEKDIQTQVGLLTDGVLPTSTNPKKFIENATSLLGLQSQELKETIDKATSDATEIALQAQTALQGAIDVSSGAVSATDYIRDLREKIPSLKKVIPDLDKAAISADYAVKNALGKGEALLDKPQVKDFIMKADMALGALSMPGGAELMATMATSQLQKRLPELKEKLIEVTGTATKFGKFTEELTKLDPGNYKAKVTGQLRQLVGKFDKNLDEAQNSALKDLPEIFGIRNLAAAQLELAKGWVKQQDVESVLNGALDQHLDPATKALRDGAKLVQDEINNGLPTFDKEATKALDKFNKLSTIAFGRAGQALQGLTKGKVPSMSRVLEAIPGALQDLLGKFGALKGLLNSFDPPITSDIKSYMQMLGKLVPDAKDNGMNGLLLRLNEISGSAAMITSAGKALMTLNSWWPTAKDKMTVADASVVSTLADKLSGDRDRKIRAGARASTATVRKENDLSFAMMLATLQKMDWLRELLMKVGTGK